MRELVPGARLVGYSPEEGWRFEVFLDADDAEPLATLASRWGLRRVPAAPRGWTTLGPLWAA